MLKPLQYRLLIALAAASLVLVGINAALFFTNRSAQNLLAARAQYVQQTQAIGSIYQEMAKALANLAIEHHDDQVQALLKEEGFTISPRPAAGNGSPPALAPARSPP